MHNLNVWVSPPRQRQAWWNVCTLIYTFEKALIFALAHLIIAACFSLWCSLRFSVAHVHSETICFLLCIILTCRWALHWQLYKQTAVKWTEGQSTGKNVCKRILMGSQTGGCCTLFLLPNYIRQMMCSFSVSHTGLQFFLLAFTLFYLFLYSAAQTFFCLDTTLQFYSYYEVCW